MSLSVICAIVRQVQSKLNADEDDISIRSVDVKDGREYTVELLVGTLVLSIRHVERNNTDLFYDAGRHYDCSVLDSERGYYVRVPL